MLDWERNWRGAGVAFVVLTIVAFFAQYCGVSCSYFGSSRWLRVAWRSGGDGS